MEIDIFSPYWRKEYIHVLSMKGRNLQLNCVSTPSSVSVSLAESGTPPLNSNSHCSSWSINWSAESWCNPFIQALL
ncbi:hypothetical protein RchiOBHm_Chr3g0469231 [Rosa chinensis]|uniref:Uncharacterized protein n=1 Tax=Rosa chinensis TaxID=74649 RepID=A0A2P6RAR8_ROSCH|nr:hypothetical protein RchiOBHm_Chr3g0469231 [Rosa chinensis]